MDTRMLDVAIGLVLVFVMFSLLVATIEETSASILNHRGDYMELMVRSLAGDNDKLAQQILSNSFLKTMMMEKRNRDLRMPSYLESDVFVTGLLAFLTSFTAGLRPASPAILVQELDTRLRPLDPQKIFISNLAALLPGVENDWPAFEKRLQAWFDAVAQRSTGWYKRKAQRWLFGYGLLFAILLNVNPIVIGQALWRDAALRAFAVEQADIALRVYYGPQDGADSAPGTVSQRLAPFVARKAQEALRSVDRALATIRLALESIHVPSDAAVVSGNAQEVLTMRRAVLEIQAALSLERSSASADPAIQRQREEAPAVVDFRRAQLRDLLPAGGAASAKSDCTLKNTLLCPIAARVDTSITELNDAIENERKYRSPAFSDAATARLLSQDCQESENMSGAMQALCSQFQDLGIFQQSSIPIGWTNAGWPPIFSSNCTNRQGEAQHRACLEAESRPPSDFSSAIDWLIAPAGWVLTAVSAMLGASFWFDLLNKLVKVRNSIKPVEPAPAVAATATGAPGAAPPPSTLSRGTAPADEAGTAPSLDAFNDTERQLTDEDIFRIQRNLGMPAARQSGRIDLATRTAIQAWQQANGATVTGELTYMQAQQLMNNASMVDDDGYVG